jgi:hypothetical protein
MLGYAIKTIKANRVAAGVKDVDLGRAVGPAYREGRQPRGTLGA